MPSRGRYLDYGSDFASQSPVLILQLVLATPDKPARPLAQFHPRSAIFISLPAYALRSFGSLALPKSISRLCAAIYFSLWLNQP
jgi:hypothetical protein